MSFLGIGPSAIEALPGQTKYNSQSPLSLAWSDESGQTISVRFDAVMAETHTAAMTLTDHPVEVGANVTDNARSNPEQISIQGFVSNKPLKSNPGADLVLIEQVVPFPSEFTKGKEPQLSLTTITNAIGNLLDPPPTSATVQAPAGDVFPDRVRKMWEKLTKARLDRALIRVVTAIEDLDSMIITNMSLPRSTADGTGATIQIELRKIRLVSALTVDAPTPAEKRGQLTASKGSKGSKGADKASTSAGQSFLVGIGKGVGLLH